MPGPACYGLGNDRPTVTDANVVLGFINASSLAGGQLHIDRAPSEQAIRVHVAEPLALRWRTRRTASGPSPTPPWRARSVPSPSSAAAIPATSR